MSNQKQLFLWGNGAMNLSPFQRKKGARDTTPSAHLLGKKKFPATKESYRVYIGISSLKADSYAY